MVRARGTLADLDDAVVVLLRLKGPFDHAGVGQMLLSQTDETTTPNKNAGVYPLHGGYIVVYTPCLFACLFVCLFDCFFIYLMFYYSYFFWG